MSANATSAQPPVKKGLRFWRSELLKVQLPALSGTARQLKTLLKDPDCSLKALEEVIAEDPVLSFELLSQASRIRHNQDTDIFSLPQALALLGMDRLRPLLGKVKYIAFDAGKTAHNAFLQALNTSLHAATQAYYLAEHHQPGSGEGHYWISLRLSSVFWRLALAAPKVYHALEQRVQQGESRHHAEQEILGCTSQQLTCSLLPDWQLSEFTQNNLQKLLTSKPRRLAQLSALAWQSGIAPEIPKDTGRFLQTPWLASVLAHWLALSSAVSWHCTRTRSIERMIATYLHQPLDRVVPLLHRNAVICSASHTLPGVWSPAVKLLHPPLPKRSRPVKADTRPRQMRYKDLSSDTRKRAELRPVREPARQTQPAASSTKTAPALQVSPAKAKATDSPQTAVQTALFKLFYLQTVKNAQVFSIHQMMDGASQVMHFDLGLTRCILFMKSRRQGKVTGVYAKGFTDNTPFSKLELNADTRHLFGKLLSKQAALMAGPENLERYRKDLPDGLWPCLDNPESFVLSSIMLRGKVSGILYADNHGSARPIGAQDYATFRALAQAISQGMNTLAEKKEQEQSR